MSHFDRRRFIGTLAATAAASSGSGWMFAAHAQANKIKPGADAALIVVDVQNCFVTGGTLPVKDGEQVVIGGNETYVSLCRRHWREAVGD